MITNISYNVLIERFRAFAEGHYLIKGFTHGDPSNVNLEKGVEFPWMHVFPVEVAPQSGSRLYSFIITFADLPRDKETPPEYQREMLSDCIRLAEDLLAEIQNGLILFGPTVELDGAASIECFINEFSHTLTGVNLSLTLSVPWDWSACDIPADWSVGGSGSGGTGAGQGGIVLETNGVLNGDQTLLNLQQGANVTIVDNGSGTITISATGGGSGTVTSVGLTAPAAFNVSGSPVTASGTLAISAAGNSGQYIDGSGNLQTFPTIPPAQVNSDWNASSGVAQILNKPTIPAAQVNSDWNASSGVAEILNKPTIPAAQVNSDWNAVSGVAQILNKPTIPGAQGLQDVITEDAVLTTNNTVSLQDNSLLFTGSDPVSNQNYGLQMAVSATSLSSGTSTGLQNIAAAVTFDGTKGYFEGSDFINSKYVAIRVDPANDELQVVTPNVNLFNATNGQVLTLVNQTTGAVEFQTPATGSGTVTSVGTTGLISGGPITTSGTITTQMATNRLVGRYSAGSGIMEQITIGSGLTLTGAGILNNSATPTATGYYGAWQDVTTQSAASNNVGYAMKFGTIDYENQVRIVTDGSNLTRITFDNTGIYNLNFSVQIQNTDNAEHDVTVWIRKNGVDVPGSAGYITVPKRRSTGAGLEGHTVAGWNYLLSVIGGDYYQIMWSTSNAANVTLQYYAAGNPPPSTASTLAIVTQQAGIMAGTGITALNALSGAVQTMGVGTSGTDFAISSAGTAHTFNLPTASASNRGALSSADWSTFNIKQAALVSGSNIKTVNSTSLVGSGDVAVQPTLVSGTNIKTINSISILGSGNIPIATTDSTVFASNPNNTQGANSTAYWAISGSLGPSSTENFRNIIMPVAGTLRNLYIRNGSTQSPTGSMTFTLRKNGADTAITITFTSSDGAATTKSDTTNSVSVAVGDLICIKAVNAAPSSASGNFVSFSILLERS